MRGLPDIYLLISHRLLLDAPLSEQPITSRERNSFPSVFSLRPIIVHIGQQ